MTDVDPQATADAAERVPLTAAQEARVYLSEPVTPKWFGRDLVRGLLAEHDEAVADRARMAAELEQMHGNAYAEAVEKYAADMADQARIKSMKIRGGTFNLELGDAREMTAALVATARTMLGDAENYSETRVGFPAGKVKWEVKLAGELDRYVFTVQRAGKLTPHEARMKAEAERDRLYDQLRAQVALHADDEDCWFEDGGEYCEVHGHLWRQPRNPCPYQAARVLLAEIRDARGGVRAVEGDGEVKG